MRKTIEENLQILLMIFLMQNGIQRLIELAWRYLEFPVNLWTRGAFILVAGVINLRVILWIQKKK